MRFRRGPAAVSGDELRDTTAQWVGRREGRTIREPEDLPHALFRRSCADRSRWQSRDLSAPFSPSVMVEKMRDIPGIIGGFGSVRRGDEARLSAVVPRDGDMLAHLHVTHGGDSAALDSGPRVFIDASASINPLGPPDWLRQEIERSISDLCHYPEPTCQTLRDTIAAHWHVDSGQVVVGNGSSELLSWLPLVAEQKHWVVPVPCYGEYRRSAALAGCRITLMPLGPAPDFALDWLALEQLLDGPTVAIFGHPNNPTGRLLEGGQFTQLRRRHPQTLFVVDEAFADFCAGYVSAWDQSADNLLVLRSLTKCLAIPGLRLGYALTNRKFAASLRERLPPWSVNLLAQRVGQRCFEDPKFLPQMQRALVPLKEQLFDGLRRLPDCRIVDGAANWVMLNLSDTKLRARDVADSCRRHGVALRACDDFAGLDGQWLRISLRNEAENERLLSTLRYVLGAPISRSAPRRTRAIMLQGSSSDAGKSLLVTALCRCLAEDGYRVAPFKAQNMSNNSGIAADGGEMGRAQVVQAWAAGLAPDTRMNPVLLKPSSDRGAQVVLRGQAIGHYDVLGYLATRQRCMQAALDAYDELAQEFDVIVCEGAGSAGEMNLRRADIVNMGFVEQRDMPVLLVGDIDRGGVYASFVGHLAVLNEFDRAKVRGFIVNRFRGDASLLSDAHQWVERHTGRPVLGVVPYLRDLVLPDEDRLSLESGRRHFGTRDAPIRIAVVVPPHVSNATDIDPLTLEPDVYLYLVERVEELGDPDVILMLGTKNTVGDLEHLRRIGLDSAIVHAQGRGVEVIGICGGLQMLGESIEDPDGVESGDGQTQGLGLLPLRTRFQGPKELRQCQARHLPSGFEIFGYEIHHGVSDFCNVTSLFLDRDGRVLGGGHPERRVWGTYVHGLFDSDAFRHQFLNGVRLRKGLLPMREDRIVYSLEPSFKRLSAVFREHVDYHAVCQSMGLT